MKTQFQNKKISEILFVPSEGCVDPDYSVSLSHLFLSLNHMHLDLSFLPSDFFIRSVGWNLAYLTCSARRQRGKHDANRRRDSTEGRSAQSCPEEIGAPATGG